MRVLKPGPPRRPAAGRLASVRRGRRGRFGLPGRSRFLFLARADLGRLGRFLFGLRLYLRFGGGRHGFRLGGRGRHRLGGGSWRGGRGGSGNSQFRQRDMVDLFFRHRVPLSRKAVQPSEKRGVKTYRKQEGGGTDGMPHDHSPFPAASGRGAPPGSGCPSAESVTNPTSLMPALRILPMTLITMP